MPSTTPVDIVRETDEMKGCIQHFALWPRQWGTYTQSHTWENEKLETANATQIPKSPGIYTLIIQPGVAGHPCSYLMYVGKTRSLRRRFREYLRMERREDGRPKISYFLNKYDQFVYFCYTLVSIEALDVVEEGLMNAYLPPLNEEYEGTISSSVRAFS
jgi:excinuclease UvrABC nuclease subunit